MIDNPNTRSTFPPKAYEMEVTSKPFGWTWIISAFVFVAAQVVLVLVAYGVTR
ncbi:MAG: hypothetical protein ACK4RV_10435 [Caulobacter sp.]